MLGGLQEKRHFVETNCFQAIWGHNWCFERPPGVWKGAGLFKTLH